MSCCAAAKPQGRADTPSKLCRMVDGDEEHPMSTFARLNTQEVPAPRDCSDFWQEPASSFLASGRRADPAESWPWHAGQLCAWPAKQVETAAHHAHCNHCILSCQLFQSMLTLRHRCVEHGHVLDIA